MNNCKTCPPGTTSHGIAGGKWSGKVVCDGCDTVLFHYNGTGPSDDGKLVVGFELKGEIMTDKEWLDSKAKAWAASFNSSGKSDPDRSPGSNGWSLESWFRGALAEAMNYGRSSQLDTLYSGNFDGKPMPDDSDEFRKSLGHAVREITKAASLPGGDLYHCSGCDWYGPKDVMDKHECMKLIKEGRPEMLPPKFSVGQQVWFDANAGWESFDIKPKWITGSIESIDNDTKDEYCIIWSAGMRYGIRKKYLRTEPPAPGNWAHPDFQDNPSYGSKALAKTLAVQPSTVGPDYLFEPGTESENYKKHLAKYFSDALSPTADISIAISDPPDPEPECDTPIEVPIGGGK